jgi:hypothetical protein
VIALEDVDGVDGPFERAARLPRRATRTTQMLPNPGERMAEFVPPPPAAPPTPAGHPVAPWDGVCTPRTRTQRIEVQTTRAAAELVAKDILGEVRDAALAQLSFRLARIEKAMVRARPRRLHDLQRRHDLVELAIAAAQRI